MRALVLLAGCAISAPAGTARIDAAGALCAALCERSDRCAPVAANRCVAACVEIACPDGCPGDVADEAQLGACLGAIDELDCSAGDLPEVCLGVLVSGRR